MDNIHLNHNQRINHFRNHLEVENIFIAYKERLDDQKPKKI